MKIEKQLSISLATIENIDTINQLLSKNAKAKKIQNIKLEKPSEEDLKKITNELIVLMADGAKEQNKIIEKAYNHHERNYSTSTRGVLEITGKAYKFLLENWDPIVTTILFLRELGYLKIEENTNIKAILGKLRKKEMSQKDENPFPFFKMKHKEDSSEKS